MKKQRREKIPQRRKTPEKICGFFPTLRVGIIISVLLALGLKTNNKDLPLPVSKTFTEKLENLYDDNLASNLVKTWELIFRDVPHYHYVFIDDLNRIVAIMSAGEKDYFDGKKTICLKPRNADGSINQMFFDILRENIGKEYPDIFVDITQEKPKIKTVNVAETANDIRNIDLYVNQTLLDATYRNSQKPLPNGQTKLEYLKKEFKKSSLPENLQKLIYYGLIGCESSYDETKTSKVKAKGEFQLMPSLLRELNIAEDEVTNLEITTPKVIQELERTYHNLAQNKDIQHIIDTFNLQPEQILFPATIQRWINGTYGVKRMFQWATANAEQFSSSPKLNTYYQITNAYRESPEGQKNKFGAYSFEYPFKIFAMAEGMKADDEAYVFYRYE